MRIVLFIVFICYSFQGLGQFIHDESYLDESFWEFKLKLEYSVSQRDTALLRSLLADQIEESEFGCGICSPADFLKQYFRQGNQAEAWDNMARVLRFGFYRKYNLNPGRPASYDSTLFQAPSYLKSIDRANETLILGENVNIRQKPSIHSEILLKASYDKFKCDCNIDTNKKTTYNRADDVDWLEIYLEDNRVGYVAAQYTSYLIIKEFTIAKINGAWKIISYYHPPGC